MCKPKSLKSQPTIFADPACGAWPSPLIANGHPSMPAIRDTVVDTSSVVDGTTIHVGESSASCNDQYALSVAKYVDELGKETFGPSNLAR